MKKISEFTDFNDKLNDVYDSLHVKTLIVSVIDNVKMIFELRLGMFYKFKLGIA